MCLTRTPCMSSETPRAAAAVRGIVSPCPVVWKGGECTDEGPSALVNTCVGEGAGVTVLFPKRTTTVRGGTLKLATGNGGLFARVPTHFLRVHKIILKGEMKL